MRLLDLRIYLAAANRKVKKFFISNFDEYGQRPSNLFLSPSQNISEKFKNSRRLLDFANYTEAPTKWQSVAREKLVQLTGYSKVRPTPEVVSYSKVVNLKSFIHKSTFYIRVDEFSDVPVHLVHKSEIPEKVPVLIFLAGSTSGVHVGWGETKVPADHERISCGSDILIRAAADGYLGVGIEQAGYGERQEKHLNKKSASRTGDAFGHLLLQGKTLVGLGASDVSSIIDWLISDNCKFDVDKNRIYLFGHSSGGTLAQYCGALDERIAGVIASGSVGPLRKTISQRGGCSEGGGVIPGFLNWLESADIVALHAPRLFITVSGKNDHIFPFHGAKSVVDEASIFYETCGAVSKIHAVEGEGGHRYYGQLSWDFFHYMAQAEVK